MGRTTLLAVAAALLWLGCDASADSDPTSGRFVICSPAPARGLTVPGRFASNGAVLSPPLKWRNPPPGTRSFALVGEELGIEDAEYPAWLSYNIPDTLTSLPLGAGNKGHSELAWNDLPGNGWSGPTRPRVRYHRFRFTLYALDTVLASRRNVFQVEPLRSAMAGRVLDSARMEYAVWARIGPVKAWQ